MNNYYITEDMSFRPNVIFPYWVYRIDISDRARWFYIKLLNKALKSSNYEEGRLYISFPIGEMTTMISKSNSSIKRILKELELAGLIDRRRVGGGNPNKIFFKVLAE